MRGRQAMKNVTANLLLQLVTAASGLILPRFYLLAYGSAMNGMVSSVGQFMSYLTLVEAGVGSASAVALYGPLSRKDERDVNAILAAAREFYIRSGVLYFILVACLTLGYPFLVEGQVAASTTRAIIMILSFSNLVDYFFLGKYRVLLNADQHGYVVTLIQCLGTVVNMVVSIALIQMGFGIAMARGVATVVYVMRSILIYRYVRRHYPYLDFHVLPNKKPLAQKWSVLLHQVVSIVVNNTDLVLLTLFLKGDSLLEVSVYSVYNMVAYNLSNVVSSFSNSLGSGFGELFAIHEEERLQDAYEAYEFLYDMLLFICYTCMAGLLASFVRIYTSDVTDVRYLRPELVMLFPLLGLLKNIRIPGLTMICAAGHYEETRWRAVAEAAINLTVSIALVNRLGIVGVLLGTLASYSYRTFDVLFYNSRHLVKGVWKRSLRRLAGNGAAAAASLGIWAVFPKFPAAGYGGCMANAVICGGISAALVLLVNWILEPEQMRLAVLRIKGILGRGSAGTREAGEVGRSAGKMENAEAGREAATAPRENTGTGQKEG